MDGSEGQNRALTAFLAAYWEDREAGRERTLEEYLVRFPGNAAGVAREFLALQDLEAPEDSSEEALDEQLEDRERAYEDKTWIGGYRLIQELGRGGQGVVHLAEDPGLRRRVALKVLPLKGNAGRTSLERFRREAEITSRLEHPGICPVYDTGMEGGLAWIAMRYVEGMTLAQLNRHARRLRGDEGALASTLAERTVRTPTKGTPSQVTEPTEVDRLCLIFERAAGALEAAHASGVIHRDVKPGNIILDAQDEPLILDFGLALEEDGEGTTLTLTGDVFGTPAYMAPEQIRGDRDKIDARTDVYALGVTLYESLTLERPFQAPTREALYRRILTEEPLPPSRLNRGVSSDLQVVVQTAMAKEPDRRYRSAAAFAEDLRRVRERQPILARPAGPLLRFQSWYRRSPALAMSVTAAFLFLVAGVVTGLLLWQRSLREAERADRRADDVRRLSDARRLDVLEARFHDDLWPPRPERLGIYEQWISDAEALLAELPRHQARLAELARRVSRDPEALSAARRKARPDLVRLDSLLAARLRGFARDMDDIEERPRYWGDGEERDLTMEYLLLMEESESELRNKVKSALQAEPVLAFENESDAWWHAQLESLVRRLEELRDGAENGTFSKIARARERCRYLQEVRRATLDEPAEAWKTCLAEIARRPHYAGLQLRPQLGLIPAGFNDQDHAEFILWEPGLQEDGRIDPAAEGPARPLVLVLLPGGRFLKGGPSPLGEYTTPKDEEYHWRRLKPFFVSKYEVTAGQWKRWTGHDPSSFMAFSPGSDGKSTKRTPDHPVQEVSFIECDRVCRWLGLDVPSEDQWEFACRGKEVTRFAWGNDIDCLRGKVNFAGGERAPSWALTQSDRKAWSDPWPGSCPVTWGEPNQFGLYHLHGNVAEWCRNRKRNRDTVKNLAPNDGRFPVLPEPNALKLRYQRGDGWDVTPRRAATSRRILTPANVGLASLGFRPVRPLDRDR